MRKHRFYEPLVSANKTFTLNIANTHHAHTVLRLPHNSVIHIFDGSLNSYTATIINSSPKGVTVQTTNIVEVEQEPPRISIFIPLLKNQRLDFLCEKATELHVKKIQLYYSDHSPINKKNKVHNKIAHLEKITISAAQQSGRNSVPPILAPAPLQELLIKTSGKTGILLPGACHKITQDIDNFVIGPEGGFSAAELAWFQQLPNSVQISIGRNILRTETAALSALATSYALCV